ncbi:FixH family protein [Ammoniphilus sp. YIM 78166]|uniref:FixH family protein n=1 Tax=Ammoniphilus sp. YIM 78166 TaxID=1644106 RepID=UPI0014315957|nr:FixH family protein [Ammoniphilus sp. YIM 78166]
MYKFIWIVFLSVFLAGCTGTNEPEPVLPVTVEFGLEPEEVKAREITTIRVQVMQGDKPVLDAQEVEFEIWKEGQEKHDMVEAEHQGDGVYSMKERFHEPGRYFVIYHVTARDMHVMQQVEIPVTGEEEKPQVEEPQADPSSQHHHHHHGVTIHFMAEQGAKAKQPQRLMAHLMKEGQPIEGARVQFEYWLGSGPNHVYVDAAEIKPGEYRAEIVPEESGNYQVITHVEKGELHEHQENSFVVD